ncbi:MAG: hypothetical protein QOI21_189 [Actinomycetota bacterium]|nr:hypothetical protein [Actinomycetota bacterium]
MTRRAESCYEGALTSVTATVKIRAGLSAIAGIVMGHLGYGRAKRGEAGGRGVATAALICGYVVSPVTK